MRLMHRMLKSQSFRPAGGVMQKPVRQKRGQPLRMNRPRPRGANRPLPKVGKKSGIPQGLSPKKNLNGGQGWPKSQRRNFQNKVLNQKSIRPNQAPGRQMQLQNRPQRKPQMGNPRPSFQKRGNLKEEKKKKDKGK
jgi:hypothetical protein